MRRQVWACLLLTVAGCRGADRTITRGVESRHEWSRRLAGVIRPGMTRDSARHLLEQNGFACEGGPGTDDSLRCDKWSGGRWAIVRRRWIATVTVASGRVATAQGNTGLVGP